MLTADGAPRLSLEDREESPGDDHVDEDQVHTPGHPGHRAQSREHRRKPTAGRLLSHHHSG